MKKRARLPAEFDDLAGLSPDLKDVIQDLNTDSIWRTFGIYRSIIRRSHLSQFLIQSRLELRKFIEDESGNPSDPLTAQRLENFWGTLMSVETTPRSVRAPLPFLVTAAVLLILTLGLGIWFMISERNQTVQTPGLPVAPIESASAPVIPKKNVDLESLSAQLNDLNAQYSNLLSKLSEIPQARETLSEEATDSANSELGTLQSEWDSGFSKFVQKLKELHGEISENPEESFPQSLQSFAQTPFNMESRTWALQVSSQLLNQLTLMTSTPEMNLDDSENESSSP